MVEERGGRWAIWWESFFCGRRESFYYGFGVFGRRGTGNQDFGYVRTGS